MPRQNTFTLVPDALGLPGLDAGPRPARPPMTSKQAQKLYRQSTRTPKLSKAEQRRLELAEQERIRKEFEKDKQAARARAARERKKNKEQLAREQRKKDGLPLVKVRPSQDTIARFVRVDSRTRELGDIAEEASNENNLREDRSIDQEVHRPPTSSRKRRKIQREAAEPHCSSSPIVFSGDVAAGRLSAHVEGENAQAGVTRQGSSPAKDGQSLQEEHTAGTRPKRPSQTASTPVLQASRPEGAEIARVLQPLSQQPTQRSQRHSQTARRVLAARQSIAPRKSSPATQTNKENEPPLPMSTQAVLSCFDEFLPSPSQELQELLGNNEGHLQRRSPMQKSDLGKRKTSMRDVVEPAMPFICSQDLVFSSQDIRELDDSPQKSQHLPASRPRSSIPNPPEVRQSIEPSARYDPATEAQPFELPVERKSDEIDTAQPRQTGKRFFTASGGLPLTQMAVFYSRKTFEEEEETRLRIARLQAQQERACKISRRETRSSQRHYTQKGRGGCANSSPHEKAASQETDYGNIELEAILSIGLPEEAINSLIEQDDSWDNDFTT
jgi:hypothetical protein